MILLFLLLGAVTGAQELGEVRGSVIDIRGGEPLARVSVRLAGTDFRTATDEEGRFSFPPAPPGSYILHVSTVGYRLLKEPFELAPGEVKEFEVILSPDTFRHSDSIEVRAGPFEPIRDDSPSELTIEGDEIKNLASVLADDPLRSVQAMPGVSSNDDFNSFFALRGADYHRVGLYVDDILVHMPFHMVAEDNPTGSLTAFNGDVAESISLHSGAFPARYADRSAGALDIHTREGSRRGVFVRGTVSMSDAGAMAEGPLGRRGAWLAAIRKSYLQYLLRRVSDDDTLAFGYIDGQGKLTYDLTSKHTVSIGLMDGFSDLDQERNWPRLSYNSPMLADYRMTMATTDWRYTPNIRFLLDNRGAYIREKYHNRNRTRDDLSRGHYGEWVWNSNGTWNWSERGSLEFGTSLRRIRDDGFWNRYLLRPYAVQRIDEYAGHARRFGAYVQQSWNVLHGRVRFSAGVRWDWHETNEVRSVTPVASVALHPLPKTQVRLGWGQYVQHPDLRWMLMRIGRPTLIPERANHFIGSIEHRLDDRTRIRAQFWNRDDRDLLFRPLAEPRIVGGDVYVPSLGAPIENSVRGYSRGFEIFVQRRSANRMSGWVSYAYGRTNSRDGFTGIHYVADRDQAHTLNIYGTYRLRPTVNLSMKWIYGSGFPIRGFYRQEGKIYYLSELRNALRQRKYHRLDVRVNKAFVYRRWKMTLYAEVINVYNRDNERFDELRRFRASDGRAWLRFYKMFPILPSVGVVFEFGG